MTVQKTFFSALIAATILLAGVCRVDARQVTVIRDGSLVFAQPDNSSAVLDILARGAQLELLEEGDRWHRVAMSGGDEGYIRSDAVGQAVMPEAFGADNVRVGSRTYLELQRSLDRAQGKMEQIVSSLDVLERQLARVDTMERREAEKATQAARGGLFADDGGFSMIVAAFYGMSVENTHPSAGLTTAWFPGLPLGMGVECEAGAVFSGGAEENYTVQGGVRLPLAGGKRVKTYLAAAGGLARHTVSAGGGADHNPLVSAGGGMVLRLAGPVALQADVRATWEFSGDETVTDGRAYIGAALLR